MSEQLVLPGFGRPPAPEPTDNLFLAFVPPIAKISLIGDRTRQFRNDHGLRGKALSPSCLHVSLHSLGKHNGLPPEFIDAASVAAATVVMPPFDVRFDRALSFQNRRARRPFVLRASHDMAALTAFHRALGEAMTKAGLGYWLTRDFTPHMTLLYDLRLVEEHAIEPLGWTVTDFVLVHSLVGQGRHIHLARWPLRG
jgi:2'-5' RNA ligase